MLGIQSSIVTFKQNTVIVMVISVYKFRNELSQYQETANGLALASTLQYFGLILCFILSANTSPCKYFLCNTFKFKICCENL